jgi:hypothetical protein
MDVDAIGLREEDRLMILVPPDAVVLVARGAEDLEDLTAARRVARAAADLHPVTRGCFVF